MTEADVLLADLEASRLALIALVLTLIAAAHLYLRAWIHRKAREADHAPAGPQPPDTGPHAYQWIAQGLRGVLGPLALLLWVHGLYFALNLLLARADQGSLAATFRLVLTWSYALTVVGALFWLLLRIGRMIESALVSFARRTRTSWDDVVLPMAGEAIRLALPLLAIMLGAPTLTLSPGLARILEHVTSMLLIGVVAFVLVRIVDATAVFLLRQHRPGAADNVHARAIQTQVVVLRKVAKTMIAVFTVAAMLMVFESVRHFGASILASAGIAGIIVGFAAQRSIATLLAGFQIALTQPIRLDDLVVINGQSGRVEDITLTYVVVRLWDRRRLVLPINYFIEQPFENWTRSSPDLLGTVFLHVDYTAPFEALREEAKRILLASPFWDGKVGEFHVTDAKEQTVEIRVLVSGADSGQTFNLRCEVREKLLAFVRQHYPRSLPRTRQTVVPPLDEPALAGQA